MNTGWCRQSLGGAAPSLAGAEFMGGRDKPDHDDL